MGDVYPVVEWTAACPTCGLDCTFRSLRPAGESRLAPVSLTCAECGTLGMWTEPPQSEPEPVLPRIHARIHRPATVPAGERRLSYARTRCLRPSPAPRLAAG